MDEPKVITVSREFLRAELTALELRLVEKLASKESVEALESRHSAKIEMLERTTLKQSGPMVDKIHELDKSMDALHTQLETLERDKAGRAAVDSFKKFLLGGGVITVFVMILQLSVTLYLAWKGANTAPQDSR